MKPEKIKPTETPIDSPEVYAKIREFIDRSPEMVTGADRTTFLASALMQVERIQAFLLLQLQQDFLSQEAYDELLKRLEISRSVIDRLRSNASEMELDLVRRHVFIALEILK